MGKRHRSLDGLEVRGSLSDDNKNVVSIKSSGNGTHGERQRRTSDSGHASAKGVVSALPSPLRLQPPRQPPPPPPPSRPPPPVPHNVTETSATPNSTPNKAPERAPASPNISAKTRDEFLSRTLHRARAYEALTQGSHKSHEKQPRDGDSDQPRQHPASLHPGSGVPSSENEVSRPARSGSSEIRANSGNWTPQQPIYAHISTDWDNQSNYSGSNRSSTSRLSNYDARLPPPLQAPQRREQEEQRRPKTRHGPEDQSRSRRPPSANRYGAPMREDDDSEDDAPSTFSNISHSPFVPRVPNHTPRSSVRSSCASERSSIHQNRTSYKPLPPTSTRAYIPYSPPYRSNQKYIPYSPPSRVLPAPRATDSSTVPPALQVSRGRRMRTPPSSSRASFASSSTAPSSRDPSREPSPSRGAWVTERPRQERLSFVDRTRERIRNSVHLNMQRAGMRPLSSFAVRGVVRTPVEDVVLSPSTRPVQGAYQVPAGRVPFAMAWRNRGEMMESWADVDGEGNRVSRYGSEDGDADVETEADGDGDGDGYGYMSEGGAPWSPDMVGLEVRTRRGESRHGEKQSRRSSEESKPKPEPEPEPEPRRTGLARIDSVDELFFEGMEAVAPTSDSFFASEWSRRQAQDMVVSSPVSPSVPHHDHPDPADAHKEQVQTESQAQNHAEAQISTRSPTPPPELPPDDRAALPSQSRHNSPAPEPSGLRPSPLTPRVEAPSRIPRRVLRKKKSRRLR